MKKLNPISRAAARLSRRAEARPAWQRTLAVALAAVLLLLPLLFLPPWRLVEMRMFDLLSILAPPRPAEAGAVIVAVDEPSLAEVGRQWPWPRDMHAALIQSLRSAGAAVIGFDVVFAEPSSPEADRALVDVIWDDVVLAGDVTVIETPQANQVMRVEPLPALLEAGAVPGIVTVTLDGDGHLRRMPPYRDSFASQILMRAEGGALPEPAPPGALIQYFGPPRSYPTVSYYQALAPDEFLPPGYFKGRIAIVGLSLQSAPTPDSGATDAFATPYTMTSGRLTAGPEVQATILDNLKHRLFILPAPLWAEILALCAAALGAGAITHRGLNWRSGPAATGLALAAFAGSWLLLRTGRVWLAPALPALAAVAVASAQGVRDYARERRMRETVSRAFGQYLSPTLVERLARDPGALRLGGERRTLSILFSDVRDFTSLAERMQDDPEGLTRLLNRLLNPLSDAVLEANGTIDKYIGDCLMAFWNAPLDDPDHAGNAVAAALAMLEAVARLNEELAGEAAATGRAAPRLAVGIGINTGACVVGNMGSDARFDYSALGDAVNLASRLEGVSKRYGVPLVIGPETEAAVRGRFVTLELDRIAVKGRTGAVGIFTVLGPADRPGGGDLGALRAAHEALLRAYRAQDWDAAEQAIARCRPLAPELAAYYDMLAARIAAFRTAPPPPDWNGVHEAAEK